MTPVNAIELLLKVNRNAAIFIITGLAILAASALVLSWSSDHENTLLVGSYILGFAFFVTIIVFVCNNELMRAVLGWAFVGTLILFLVGFVGSVIRVPNTMPVPYCYVRMLVQPPARCEAEHIPAEEITQRQSIQKFATRSAGPERIWLAQAVDPDTGAKATGEVYLQYGNGVADLEAQGLTDGLTDQGYSVKTRGLVLRDAPTSEVRYYNPEDAEQAREAAKWLKEQRPDSQIYLRDYSGSGVIADEGVIELWVTQ